MPKPRLSHQARLSVFPHLAYGEFESAINKLTQKNHQHDQKHNEWISTDVVTANGITYLSIAKPLLSNTVLMPKHDEADGEVEEDDDHEALHRPMPSQPVSHYDIILSPTYRVPVLYISISDIQQRYPPTIATLTEHLVPSQFQAETERVGVISGITVTEHPAMNRPVFFIHPCQTAEVMERVVGDRRITADEYLIMWLGAFGKCVGLDVPLSLATEMDSTEQNLD